MIYLAKGGFWLTLGQIIFSVSSFLLAIAFANLLSKNDYGTYQYILSIFGILCIFNLPGISTALNRTVAKGYEKTVYPAIKNQIKFGTLGGLTALTMAGYYYLQGNNTLFLGLLISAVFLPIQNSFLIFQSYLQGKKQFKAYIKFSSTQRIISYFLIFLGLIFSKNIIIILLIYLASQSIINIILFLLTLKKYPPQGEVNQSSIGYGKHLSLMEVIMSVADRADNILIFHYLGAAPLAIYNIALSPVSQISSYLSNLKILAFPKLSNVGTATIKRTLPGQILKLTFLLLPILIIYVIIVPFIYPVLFPAYQASIFLSQILALKILFLSRMFFEASLTAQRQVKSLYIIRIIGPIGRVIIYFILIKNFGLVGLATAVVIAEFYIFILQYLFFKKMR
jgi:O-antigen/teichoic acid export membrane protein